MSWLNHILDDGWTVTPAGGLTGDAYIAASKDERLFLKRNSSPFLAVLSAEGIVPKLVWTKRLKNGDVITAQEWVEGRELQPEEMQHADVADLLRRIHDSSELLHMLLRLGNKPLSRDTQQKMLEDRLIQYGFAGDKHVQYALKYMESLLPAISGDEQVVCHCDLNHNNLLLTKDEELFLVDWENASITDPAIDFGTVLQWYIPRVDWKRWLELYGATYDISLMKRMYWYLLADNLQYMLWHYERKEYTRVLDRENDLQYLNRDAHNTFSL